MKRVIVLEVYGATDEQIQNGLGKAFTDFCEDYKGTGITANVLSDNAGKNVITYIKEEAILCPSITQ